MLNKRKILKNLPKTVILEIKNDYIIDSYGNKKNNKKYQNRYLSEVFSAKNYKNLQKLQSKKKKKIFLIWDKKEYEVFCKKNILYFYDITQFSNVEQKLKKSLKELISKQEKLQAVFDLAANGISILDKNGMFLYANKFFQNMMEYTMEELYKESCISLSSPEYSKPSETAVQKGDCSKICVK